MKLLKLHVTGLPLFKEPVDLTFYATQRVSDEDSRSEEHTSELQSP